VLADVFGAGARERRYSQAMQVRGDGAAVRGVSEEVMRRELVARVPCGRCEWLDVRAFRRGGDPRLLES